MPNKDLARARAITMPAILTVKNAHGTFDANAGKVDIIAGNYLPASVNDMRTIFIEHVGCAESDYSDVHSVIEFVVMLASVVSMEGFDY